ncbi:hypothetical protein [Methylobacter sp. S3L5C]|uniref:hypothetical protein n=1 Tax=Methylobacter sp. S3L5C TaxID=2839024 RepID=UPI001FAD4FD5|nr:hypothetical protein [Methylobacter sp. S3L5C]UOA10265.1 hypothetical protein KKZ03_08550 [Methylobacter sp. S3L5C]
MLYKKSAPKTDSYDTSALANDLIRALGSVRSNFLKLDLKELAVRVPQLRGHDELFKAQFAHLQALVNKSDYLTSEAMQNSAVGLIESLIRDLYLAIPKSRRNELCLTQAICIKLAL